MTGFGRGEALLGAEPLSAEVRSVNGRYLECRVRGARELTGADAWVRELVGEHLRRGQVDVQLRLAGARRESEVELDLAAARSYLAAARELSESAGAAGELEVATLLSLPGVARLRELELDPEALQRAARAALTQACRAAAEMRAREGEALERFVLGALDTLASLLGQIEARAEDVKKGLLQRLRERIAELAPELELAPAARLDQELVFYLDRMDITEEIVRLRSHFAQFRETLASDAAVGRKLEFLLQEMGREVNTIGSKAADAPITHVVVELKAELEKLREQVLNVE